MSSIVNKVKDALSSDKKHEQPEGTHGHHDSRVANAADPRIDSDRDHRANPAGTTGTHTGTHTGTSGLTGTTGAHTTGTHGTHTGTTGGLTGSNVTGTHTGHTGVGGYDGPAPTTAGPHKSDALNKADPRVDSDHSKDHHNTHTTGGLTGNPAGAGHHTTGAHAGTHGTHTGTTGGLTGSNTVTGYDDPTGTHGTHNSRVANAADPRIDSDRDHRGAPGHTGIGGAGVGGVGSTGTHTGTHTGTSGLTGTHGTHGTHTGTTGGLTGSNTVTGYDDPDGTHGTHNSRIANKADPRIDSDRDHRGAPGHTGVGAGVGSTGTHTGTHTTGTHTGAHTGAHTGVGHTGVGANTHSATTGPAPGTAGPHKSDFLNKADPRVDSDLDGSKTIGGNKTGTSGTTGHAKDPTDAAQVPPSVLAKHVGEPETAHGGVHGDHGRRNSIPSHQETHRGL
ncbi:hypothetical protein CCUS01_00480 [Colletotrichum cuscutae]|uniref:Cell surface protein n=1 Tax=Colletotrichum cuscutae TaxID=1209917 RepID=A0AAI9VBB8_9PEZI|nr:hypothetical protein CCUS01_00480 [Colletotrichum cuscutae]